MEKLAKGSLFLIFSLYAIIFLSLFVFFNPAGFMKTLASSRTLYSIKLTLLTALVSSTISMTLAIPAGYALSRYDFRGKWLIDATLELPLVISPLALGAACLIFFYTRTGTMIQENMIYFVYEISGIILAQFLTSAGMATRIVKSVFNSIPVDYEEIAYSLGVPPARTFLRVTLPMARGGLISGFILTFAKCIGEFGATITIAGAMPMKTETLPISIFLKIAAADIEGAVLFIILLVLLGITVISLSKRLLDSSIEV